MVCPQPRSLSKATSMPHFSASAVHNTQNTPLLRIVESSQVVASGTWRVEALASRQTLDSIHTTISMLAFRKEVTWDLSQISGLDYIGAQLLWDAWEHVLPSGLKLRPEHHALFERLASVSLHSPAGEKDSEFSITGYIYDSLRSLQDHLAGIVTLMGQCVLDLWIFVKNPANGPWREISANIYQAGARALGITAMVGFLIGVVLAYLSGQQLKSFGGDSYLVNLLGVGITRELGPLLAAILVAGRSGSSMAAKIGVMRVTEELDAMLVMGIPHGFRLVLPKTIALAIVMPLLVMWTNIFAMLGGMLAANYSIGLAVSYFISALPDATPVGSLIIGISKGVIFGILIALISCHFGLRIEPNTESLGTGTTSAVVTAITIVILVNAILAVALWEVGWT